MWLPKVQRPLIIGSLADCKSAIQQTACLRYVRDPRSERPTLAPQPLQLPQLPNCLPRLTLPDRTVSLRVLRLERAMDYKSTLNLPQTAFPMKADLVVREPQRLAQWQASRLYERIQFALGWFAQVLDVRG